MAFKTFLIVIFLLPFAQVKSQAPSWDWARSPTSGSGTYALGDVWCNAADAIGNSYIAGVFKDTLIFGTDTLKESLGLTAFVAKYNTEGDFMWAHQATGSGYSWVNAVATDPDGNVYITGYFNAGSISFDTIVLNNVGGHDMFITKYNSTGDILWAKTFGANGNCDVSGMATDALGNVYTTGYFDSPSIDFDSFTLTNTGMPGTTDFFITKLNPEGIVLWAKSGIGNSVDIGVSVSIDTSSNVYVSGNFSSAQLIVGFDTLSNVNTNNTHDLFIIKYDANGNALWSRSNGGKEQEYAHASTTDDGGNLLLTGFFDSPTLVFGDDTLHHVGAYNIFIVKYDSSGNVNWARSQTEGSGGSSSIVSNGCGNIVLTGGILSPTIAFDSIVFAPDSLNSDDMFIAGFDPSGNALWGNAFSFGGDDVIAIAMDASNHAYLGGDFASDVIIIGGDTLINMEAETPFVAKLSFDCHVGISEITSDFDFSIFPNPTSTTITISLPCNQNAMLSIFNLFGEKVKQEKVTGKQVTMDVSSLPQGLYLVRMENSVVGKFVKE